jgi:DNA-binding transcriptional ArsR family regulator
MKLAVAFAEGLADETRWRIAMLIREEALCVCELVDALRLAQSTLSSHLQVMRLGGLVTVERCEKWAYYRLDRRVVPIFNALRRHFAASLERDGTLRADQRRMAARLALRGQSDCRGPRRAIPPAGPPRKEAACC